MNFLLILFSFICNLGFAEVYDTDQIQEILYYDYHPSFPLKTYDLETVPENNTKDFNVNGDIEIIFFQSMEYKDINNRVRLIDTETFSNIEGEVLGLGENHFIFRPRKSLNALRKYVLIIDVSKIVNTNEHNFHYSYFTTAGMGSKKNKKGESNDKENTRVIKLFEKNKGKFITLCPNLNGKVNNEKQQLYYLDKQFYSFYIGNNDIYLYRLKSHRQYFSMDGRWCSFLLKTVDSDNSQEIQWQQKIILN